VFYHDAAVNCPRYGGLPDFTTEEQRSPDVDILCMASYENATHYPEYIATNHHPANIIVGHWEDFPPVAREKAESSPAHRWCALHETAGRMQLPD